MKLPSFCVLSIIFSIPPFLGEAYRILGVFPFHGSSHFVMFERLMKGLASRGHQVDIVSHYPLKKSFPNYNDVVDLTGTVPDLRNNMTYEFATQQLAKMSLVVTIATQLGGDLCDLMDLPKFRELIKNPPKDPPYDLLIVEIFGSTCYLALGKHLKVPMVTVITSPVWPWANGKVANPDHPAFIPHVLSGLHGQMDFWQRMQNTVTFALGLGLAGLVYKPPLSAYQDEKIKKYIGPHAPSLEDAGKDVSLILVNSHYSLNGVRPFTTAVIEVGGLHIKENETSLPNDLQKWLDDSTSGFILVTFGSMLRIETFPEETLAAMYVSLGKLAPTRVLIKVVNKKELPPGLPSNILTLPWIPQSAVLQHKNIRAFMTHGGLMGTQEAVYRGVPMIGVPVFADQAQNIELYKQKKIAVRLNYGQLTEENLEAAFNTILHDPSYMESAKKLATEFRDRPMTALDTAVFWVEYVIRHGGKNLRSPALDLTWWQIALLDVYGTVLTSVIFAIYLLKVVTCKIKDTVLVSDLKKTSRSKKIE